MPLDPRTPTVSLQMARNLLAQPETDPLGLGDLQNYDATATQNAVNRNLPDFFRQMADQIAGYNANAQAQRAAFDESMAGGDSGGAADVADYQPAVSGRLRDTMLTQRAAAEAAQQKQVADMAAQAQATQAAQAAAQPEQQTVAPESGGGGNALGSLWEHAKNLGESVANVAKDVVTSPIALPKTVVEDITHPQDIPEDVVNDIQRRAYNLVSATRQSLGLPVEAFEALPARAFIEPVRRAAQLVGYNPPVEEGGTLGEAITHAGEKPLGPIPGGVISTIGHLATGAAVWAPLGAVAKALSISPKIMDALFTGDALISTKPYLDAYQNGEMSGQDAIKGAIVTAGPQVITAGLVHGLGALEGRRAEGVAQDVKGQIAKIKEETAGRPAVDVAETLRDKGLAKSMEELDYENNLRKLGVTPEEAVAQAAQATKAGELAVPVMPVGEEPVVAAKPVRTITEEPQTGAATQMGRHRLTTPEGDRLDWRLTPDGAHIQDVTVQAERQGTGTALVDRAVADIRAQRPDAVITADLNSEGGARLMARQGAEFATKDGAALTPEDAIASAARGEGPVATLHPEPAKPREAVVSATPEIPSPLEHDPAFKAFEAETDAGVQEHIAPLAKGARDEIGDRITIQDGAYKALADYGLEARGHAGLSVPMKAAVREITDGRSSFVKSLPDANLQDISANEGLPKWQREIANNELTSRTQPVENAVSAFKQTDAPVQQTLRDMGYEHMPSNPIEVARVHQAMDDLGFANSIPALQDWMSKHPDLLEQPISTGTDSPFRVNGKFDFDAARDDLRSQARRSGKLNDIDGTERPVADAIGARKVADLGNCGMKAVA